jgi:hypothetical protein
MGDDRPSAFNDVRKGLGLLLRAARTAVSRLPTTDLEEAVVTSAREVGRAIENVATTIEREVLGKAKPRAGGSRSPDAGEHPDPSRDQGKADGGPPDAK